jgi:hypothetical protein
MSARPQAESVTLAPAVRAFLSHLRHVGSQGAGADVSSTNGAGGGGGGAVGGITDDQAARCASILKVAAWANSCSEVTLRDCVLVQYLAARPGCTRLDINLVFQAFAWREATGKDAESAAVGSVAAVAAAELAEAAVQRVEQAHSAHVGRCGLTASKPVSMALMGSALDAKI